MDNPKNTMSFCRDTYKDFGDDEPNEVELFSDLTEFIRIAIKNGCQMKIWDDGCTIIVEYDYQDPNLSGTSLVWLSDNEYISTYGDDNED